MLDSMELHAWRLWQVRTRSVTSQRCMRRYTTDLIVGELRGPAEEPRDPTRAIACRKV